MSNVHVVQGVLDGYWSVHVDGCLGPDCQVCGSRLGVGVTNVPTGDHPRVPRLTSTPPIWGQGQRYQGFDII